MNMNLDHLDIRSRRNFVSSVLAGAGMLVGAPMVMGSALGAVQAPPGGVQRPGARQHHEPRPRPAGLVWVSGTGSNDQRGAKVSVTDPLEEHVTRTMESLKRTAERLGGTMDDFMYMQVFYCLPVDDSYKMPTGSALFKAYEDYYTRLNKIYFTYWTGPHGAPPRNCQALSWIPGNSLCEIQGALYIPSK